MVSQSQNIVILPFASFTSLNLIHHMTLNLIFTLHMFGMTYVVLHALWTLCKETVFMS